MKQDLHSSLTQDDTFSEDIAQAYKEHRDQGLKYLISLGASYDTAADLYQDSIVDSWINIKNGLFKGNSTFKTYLFSICKNKWSKYLEEHTKKYSFTELDLNLADEAEAATEEILLKEQRIQSIIEGLKEIKGTSCRELLELFYFEKKTISELTRHFDYADDHTTSNLKHKCQKRIKELILKKYLKQ